MIKLLNRTTGRVIGVEISGKMSNDGINMFRDTFMKVMSKLGGVNILIVIKGFFYYNSLDLLFKDLKFIDEHKDSINKIAIVGDNPLKQLASTLTALYFKDQRYFDISEIDKAWEWVDSRS